MSRGKKMPLWEVYRSELLTAFITLVVPGTAIGFWFIDRSVLSIIAAINMWCTIFIVYVISTRYFFDRVRYSVMGVKGGEHKEYNKLEKAIQEDERDYIFNLIENHSQELMPKLNLTKEMLRDDPSLTKHLGKALMGTSLFGTLAEKLLGPDHPASQLLNIPLVDKAIQSGADKALSKIISNRSKSDTTEGKRKEKPANFPQFTA